MSNLKLFGGGDMAAIYIVVNAPGEGIMGLTRDGKIMIVKNNDMISSEAVHPQFLDTLLFRGMLRPVNLDISWPGDLSNHKQTIQGKRKNMRQVGLDRWLK